MFLVTTTARVGLVLIREEPSMSRVYRGLTLIEPQPEPACRSWVRNGLCTLGMLAAWPALILLLCVFVRVVSAGEKPPEAPSSAEFYVTFEGQPDALYAEDEDTGQFWVYDETTSTWEVCARPLGKGTRVRVHSSGRFRAHGSG